VPFAPLGGRTAPPRRAGHCVTGVPVQMPSYVPVYATPSAVTPAIVPVCRCESWSPTSIAVGWGGWHPHGLVPPAAGKSGFVLKLHHVATDSVPLLIATDGNITTGPSQGRPPPEWTDPAYQPIQWP